MEALWLLLTSILQFAILVSMPTIRLEKVTVNYVNNANNQVTVLNDMDAVFESGKFHVILGYSGSGKTTLIQTIIGFLPYYGDIYFDDTNALKLKINQRDLSYVSQDYVLYPGKTIFENIAFPLRLKGCPREEIIQRVNDIAKLYGIEHCLFRKPKHLSGGQKQKVAMARALVKNSSLYLFDEPFSNVDPLARGEEERYLKKCLSEHGATTIYATHDFKEALNLADYIYILDQGKIVFKGTPEDILECSLDIAVSLRKASLDGKI